MVLAGFPRDQNNPSLAMICYKEALEHNANDFDAMVGMSEVHFSLGNYNGAEVELSDLLAMDPDHAEGPFLMANVHRVRHEMSLHGHGDQPRNRAHIAKMVGEVVHFYKRTIEVNPENDAAYSSLGAYYLGLGDFDLATSTFEEGLRIKPESDVLLLGLADTY